jgi:hypothetical protein
VLVHVESERGIFLSIIQLDMKAHGFILIIYLYQWNHLIMPYIERSGAYSFWSVSLSVCKNFNNLAISFEW